MAEPVCPVCFSGEMIWLGGSLVCGVCGSQSQVELHQTPCVH